MCQAGEQFMVSTAALELYIRALAGLCFPYIIVHNPVFRSYQGAYTCHSTASVVIVAFLVLGEGAWVCGHSHKYAERDILSLN